jgi:hypothetical protein
MVPAAANAAERYSATTFGGKPVGATGPDAAPVGSSPYAVRQAVVTEPQMTQTPGATAPVVLAQGTAASPFGPPPLPPPQQYAPASPQQYDPAAPPQYGPTPQYGPGPGLVPDPNITPVEPQMQPALSTNAVDRSRRLPDPAVDMILN